MTEPSSPSPLAPPSDAELLRLAGKPREMGQALDQTLSSTRGLSW
jgi:hypothetical protein